MSEIIKQLMESYNKKIQEYLKDYPFCIEVTDKHIDKFVRLGVDFKRIYKETILIGRRKISVFYACFKSEKEAKEAIEKANKMR